MSRLLYGHRGASAERPENTLGSFRRALELGADALELDVHLTADGQVVVFHDDSAERMAGIPRRIARSTLAEVQSWDVGWGFVDEDGQRPFGGAGYRAPRLAEVVDELPGVVLNVEIKPRSLAVVDPLLALIRSRRAEPRVTLASFHGPIMREVRRRGYAGPTALARPEVAAVLGVPWQLRGLWPVADAAQVPVEAGVLRLGSRWFIERCHRLGMRVDFWTVDQPDVASELLAVGADGIMSNDPGAMGPVFARWRKQ